MFFAPLGFGGHSADRYKHPFDAAFKQIEPDPKNQWIKESLVVLVSDQFLLLPSILKGFLIFTDFVLFHESLRTDLHADV